MKRLRVIGLLLFVFGFQLVPSSLLPVSATGNWNGQDSFFVPMSWCIVNGSPAQANPNLAGDTDTDAIIWRRHERPTDNIYINPTGISFRSTINNTWGTFNFPTMNDTDTALATVSDVRGENVNIAGVEYNALINNCDTAYNNLGRAGIGVTVVNIGLFHDAAGNYNGVPIGWGGCAESPAGTCRAPYDGRVMVVDNRYLHPASPNRTWPGSTFQFTATDPLDQLVGHELGHALSLDHRVNNAALMNPGQVDDNGNGQVDNIGLNAAEIAALRANARNVPGVQIDPQGEFFIGRYVATRIPDKVQEFDDLPAYLDLASVRVSIDKEEKRVFIDQQLFGLLPQEGGEPVEAWSLIDLDGAETGIDPDLLREIGVPETRFLGADVVARVIVRGEEVIGEVWRFENNELVQVDGDLFLPELLTMVVHPHYAPSTDPNERLPEAIEQPLHHLISITMPQEILNVELAKPFRLQTFITQAGQTVVDRFNDEQEQEGEIFIVEDPSFPECTPLADGTAGGTVQIEIRGLLTNANIHGLLGPLMVFTGTSDDQGGGIIDFPIPSDTASGYHLVTIGVDGTALTADCMINVTGRDGGGTEEPPTGGEIPPDEFALLRSHEDLLRRQQILIDTLGRLIENLSSRQNITDAQVAALVQQYARLVLQQAELLDGFEGMIHESMQ